MIRWTARKKAELLAIIDSNPAKGDALIKFHELSPEELIEWRKALSIELRALKATKLHQYQPARSRYYDPSKYTRKKPGPKPKHLK